MFIFTDFLCTLPIKCYSTCYYDYSPSVSRGSSKPPKIKKTNIDTGKRTRPSQVEVSAIFTLNISLGLSFCLPPYILIIHSPLPFIQSNRFMETFLGTFDQIMLTTFWQ